ncbi:hypothetical protein METBIDRAFT_42033 [Metschnikowia bicuspidata var. bicuspidata NRRL YB-4993]|uniref:Mediator of RNA polymerase II transcription subunit 11 n=1 Tax=Metschnikowia bicuspidata var. bicuspidata NRRL YB-4993 TaxID=869754 RepID=A0A1A0HB03_9ASCO|nr:hypothetical protein METBIDRAFT_42033 [Metschnikowia bicuspidata var. bicuspidata NRRL YB-4993]OBA21191.1 hypothetical protein METBIDRAFT_42033 [Metschnikowia bicuspidata var. bicuspidata NRRL YB-4993]
MFIEQRLEALNKIDEGIVQLLESLGCIFETYTVPSKSDFQDVSQIRDHFSGDVRKFYSSLSNVAISLRKEVKLLDDNTGTSQLNKDLVMVLPVSVEKKNTALGEIKLEAELKNLE